MAGFRHGFNVRSEGRRPPRRILAALSSALLIASLCVPVATVTAESRGHSFGGIAHVEKTVGAMKHIDSMRVVADQAALNPRTDKAPALNPKAPQIGTSAGPRQLSPRAVATKTSSSPRPLIVTPDVAASTTFAGLTEAESGNVIPADPWVAVNSSYVVQAVNSMVRVSNRVGTTLTSVPLDAFFSVEPGYYPTDPRVIWDATHGRWIGEVAFFNNDFSSNGFVLAISEGSDPTQGWNMWPIFFGPYLPDYPSIASSNDKIVIADDLYDQSLVFQGADLNTFTWSELNTGTNVFDRFCDDSTLVHPRAAQVLSSSNDVHVVLEEIADAHQIYVRVTGNGQCLDIADFTDLTTDLSFDALDWAPPVAPRQPGPDTIDNATDDRYTDAVWRNNQLYWVNTMPVTYGSGFNSDQVLVWSTTTASVSGSPSGFGYAYIRPGEGTDAYMGGIGLTRNGNPIISYSQSSSTDYIAFYAAEAFAVDSGGGSVGTPVLLDTSEAAITGERWGDYAGVAMDPVGTGSVWVTHMLAGEDGKWRTTIARMLVDNDLPSTPSAPAASPVTNTKLGILPKFKVAWGAATDGMSGTVQYILEQNVAGGGFAYAGTFTGTSTIRSLNPGNTYQFRVTAIDPLGNVGGTATGPVLHISTAQSPTSKTGTWHTQSSTNFLNGSTWYATAAGASASYKATGVRSIAIITTKASSRGSFKVYIDGSLKATISAYSTSTAYRQVLYQFSWSSPGTHTIKIVVKGTSGHPRVDFDGVLLIK